MNRHWTILAFLLAALALGCGGDATDEAHEGAGGPPPKITVGHVGHDHHISLYVAALEPDRIKEKCGIALVEKKAREVYDLVEGDTVLAQLHLKKVGGGSKMPAAMERGEIEVGLGGIPAVMRAIDGGQATKILCPLNVDGDMLLMRTEIPVTDWDSFVAYVKASNKPVKIGYKAPVAVAKLVLVGALDAAGVPHGKEGQAGGVQLVNLQGGKKIVPSLEKGIVDGAVINEPFGSLAVDKNKGKIVSLLSALPPEGRWLNHPCCCVCATEKVIGKNRDALKALLKLVKTSTEFILANPEDAARLASAWTKQDLSVEISSVPNIVYITDPGEGYRQGMKVWWELMSKTDVFEERLKGVSFEEAFELGHDLTLYQEVLEGR